MSCRSNFASLLVSLGLIISSGSAYSESDPSSKYKVLATEKSGLNIGIVSNFLDQADSFEDMNSDGIYNVIDIILMVDIIINL